MALASRRPRTLLINTWRLLGAPAVARFATLAYEEILSPGPPLRGDDIAAEPADGSNGSLQTALVIHGLFGTGRNWRTPARSLGKAASQLAPPGSPGWRIILLDLRNHGRSAELLGLDPPHDMVASAQDVINLVDDKAWGNVHVAIGHSLGGKVVLEYAKKLSEREGPGVSSLLPPKQVWVLDSVPGAIVSEPGGGDVEKVIAILKALPHPVPSRRWLLQHLQGLGLSRGLAEWMASNLKRPDGASNGEEMTWLFDALGAAQMYDSYKATDMMPFVQNVPGGMSLDFVRAERSDRWTPSIVAALEAVAGRQVEEGHGKVGVQVLPRAGHWLHVDNPEGLVQMLAPSLARISASAMKS